VTSASRASRLALLAAIALLAACGGGSGLAAAGLPGESPSRAPDGPPLPAPPASAAVSPSGTERRSAAELLRAARAAFAAAPSVRVTGTLVKGAQGYDLDLRLKGRAGGTARIEPSTRAPGPGPDPVVDVIRIGDVAWVGGNLGFWRSVTGEEARARALVGSWVRVAADGGDFGEYVAFTRPETLTALLPEPAQPAAVEPRVPFDGRPAIPVVVDRVTRLTVAAAGAPYPLQLSGLTGDATVSRFLTFSGYGADVPLRAPVPATVDTGSRAGS
jgi:hypothetical protein